MGRTKAKPKKVGGSDLVSNTLGADEAAPRKRGRPRKVIKHENDHEMEEEEDEEEEHLKEEEEIHDIDNEGGNGLVDLKPFVDSSPQDLPVNGHKKDVKEENHATKEEGIRSAIIPPGPKKRGRPPKSLARSKSAAQDQEIRETNAIKSGKKQGLSRRKSEPHRAAGIAGK